MEISLQQKADAMNVLFSYLALRELPALTRDAVVSKIGGPADWLVLFGGSIPEGAELAARAMGEGAAKKLMLVGGEGHTTQALRDHIRARCPRIATSGRTEAEVLFDYLLQAHGLRPDAMECKSTNCGNNVSFCLELFKSMGELPKSLILMQDATMQRRMELTFQKVWAGLNVKMLHYASYDQRVVVADGFLCYEHKDLWGMWEMDRFLSLLMGEIPRLRDDADGYGPKGKGFLAHADIPDEVLLAYALLESASPKLVRRADEKYAKALS